jgi:RNA polymerase sigma factor (sigma-70 family)
MCGWLARVWLGAELQPIGGCRGSLGVSERLRRRLRTDLDDGFVELVVAFGAMVHAIGRRLGDPSSAEDATQDTFVRAYRSLSGMGGDEIDRLDLRPWLATVAINTVRNEQRRRARRPTQPLAEQHRQPRTDDVHTPEDLAVSHETLRDLGGLLDQLPQGQRDAVVLRHVAGLSTREAATALGIPEGTAKSNLSRGLRSLRNALETKETT